MSCKYEIIEPNKVKITFELSPESFEKGCQEAYLKNRGKINIPGFRKGRAPRKIIELNFGKDIFYEDAINILLPDAYEAAVKELNLDTVSPPEVDIEGITEENLVTLTALTYTKPAVSVETNDYIGITYEMTEASVFDEEIDEEINKAREQNARIIDVADRASKDQDIVVIDFEGFIDGVAFEGGKGQDYELTLGSKTFIEGFEDQLIGHNIGDEIEVNVTFPENYGKKELEGQPALFEVTLKEIKCKELPEVDDDFAQDVSGLETLEEYKSSIREKLQTNKDNLAKNKKESDIISVLCDNITFDIPEVMVDNQVEQMIRDFGNRLRAQGLPLEAYLQYTGQDIDVFRQSYREDALRQVKTRLILEAIGKKEGFAVTDEEFEEEVTQMAESYRMEKDRLMNMLNQEGREELELDIKVKKAIDYVIENAVSK